MKGSVLLVVISLLFFSLDAHGCVDGKWGSNCDMKCSQFCLVCAEYNGDCMKCSEGYVLRRYYNQNRWITACDRHNCLDTCSLCENDHSCTQCRDGYFGYACESRCSSTCIKCSSQEICFECYQGFHLINNKCVCPEGYYNNENQCLSCKGKCKTCIDIYGCKECITGYYLATGYYLPTGYYLAKGDCQPCGYPCDVCNSSYHCETCRKGYYTDNGVCKKCPRNCIDCSWDTLCHSCISGYYGTICADRCENNCLKCDKNSGRCSSCKTGYKGHTCQSLCSNCKPSTVCEQFNGYCKEGCIEGYSGDFCDIRCTSKCKSCLRNNELSCTSCADNKFGISKVTLTCDKQCSDVCRNNTCDDETGYCTTGCENSFWGKKCEYSCSSHCRYRSCNRENGSCISGCLDNYTGSDCRCPANCECSDTSECRACKAGFGNINKNCTCTTNQCTTNACETCNDSRYFADGGACCPCSQNCKNGRCSAANVCLDGCVDGAFGSGCSKRCENVDLFCVKCLTVNMTDNEYGGCTSCSTGHFPDETKTCKNCSEHCLNDECDRQTGKCSILCINGTWGDRCEYMCQEDCIKCKQDNGICQFCKENRFLSDCSAACSETCKSVIGSQTCNITDGTCLHGCLFDNVFGLQCNYSCRSTCYNGACDRWTGHCISGCQNNSYGEFCESKCKHTCTETQSENTCFQTNGSCILDCEEGRYGDMCDWKCSAGCKNSSCNRQSGECYDGCNKGYKGTFCNEVLVQKSRFMQMINKVPAISVVVVIIAIVATVVNVGMEWDCSQSMMADATGPLAQTENTHDGLEEEDMYIVPRGSDPSIKAGYIELHIAGSTRLSNSSDYVLSDDIQNPEYKQISTSASGNYSVICETQNPAKVQITHDLSYTELQDIQYTTADENYSEVDFRI